MGFNSVYKSLQEIFPQVDARLLRAVAIEHPKDADIAAGIILNEVIPLMSKRSRLPSTPAQDTPRRTPISEGALISPAQDTSPRTPIFEGALISPAQDAPPRTSMFEVGNELQYFQPFVEETDVGPSSTPQYVSALNINSAEYSSGLHLNETLDEQPSLSNAGSGKFPEENFTAEASEDVQSESLTTSGINHEMGHEQTSSDSNTISTKSSGDESAVDLDKECKDLDGHASDDYDIIISAESHSFKDGEVTLFEVESSEAEAVCEVPVHVPNAEECTLQPEVDYRASSIPVGNNLEGGSSLSKQDYPVSETNDIEDEISQNSMDAQSSEACRIDLLEEIIEEAKTNKRTLYSSMESLINLMREVELEEKAAEQARMEAALGGSDLLARWEELKTMLAHAKEANDMHAGEVYGEKAILATEMRELQSRLFCLSNERDKHLALLDEMHQSLEARLAAAAELRKAADQEKQEKEDSAWRALSEQEVVMEKVVEESKRLQQDAEENSKLREFLMDRGRVVDALQGEISVICQDIRLLKEKFDANLPLNKSFTSCQTSCILASSGSSQKGLASDAGAERGDLSELLKISPEGSIDGLSSKSGHEEDRAKADHKALLDDGWDIFEKDTEFNF